MALNSVTFLDLKEEVWMRLKGQAGANTAWGEDRIEDAINRAVPLVLVSAGTASLAGELYTSNTYALTTSSPTNYNLTDDSIYVNTATKNACLAVLIPLSIEIWHNVGASIQSVTAEQCKCQRVTPEELFKMNKSAIYLTAVGSKAKLFYYAFTGTTLWIRPLVVGAASTANAQIILHYIKHPFTMTANSDVCNFSTKLTRSIVALAAADCLCQMESVPLEDVISARMESERELKILETIRNDEIMRDWAMRTGRNRFAPEGAPGALSGGR